MQSILVKNLTNIASFKASLILFFAILIFSITPNSIAEELEATVTDREFVEMQTSVNVIMVAVVDWSAHEVWKAGYTDFMTDRNWLTVKQYATQLLSAGTLVSLGGPSSTDQAWVKDPLWQEWTKKMIMETKGVLIAIEEKSHTGLVNAGGRLIETCVGCHKVFKPELRTEGISHIPHHDYGDPLSY